MKKENKIKKEAKIVMVGKKPVKLHTVILLIGILSMVALIIALGGLNVVMNWFWEQEIKVPELVWIILISAVSSFVTYYIMRRFVVSPLLKLQSAMTEVSKGDFAIQLATNSKIDEIKKSYNAFNIMVKELRSTELLQSDFVANVSHEFKTPISSIEGYATLLQAENQSAETREYIDKILFSTKRLSRLIGEILLLSKIENQSISTKNERYCLDEQIRQAVVALETKWEAKNLDFDANLDEIYYCGNESLLFRVWANLIDNAIKFSPNNQVITLNLVKQDDSIVFSIADKGVGISNDAKFHIFDKFYQEDNSHSKEGNGLGLTLVKRIVQAHNGSVSVQDNDGGGTIFVVKLPVN